MKKRPVLGVFFQFLQRGEHFTLSIWNFNSRFNWSRRKKFITHIFRIVSVYLVCCHCSELKAGGIEIVQKTGVNIFPNFNTLRLNIRDGTFIHCENIIWVFERLDIGVKQFNKTTKTSESFVSLADSGEPMCEKPSGNGNNQCDNGNCDSHPVLIWYAGFHWYH